MKKKNINRKNPQTAQTLIFVLFVVLLPILLKEQSFGQAERRKWEEPQNLAILNTLGDEFAPIFSPQDKSFYYTTNSGISSVGGSTNGFATFYTSKFDTRRDASSGEVRPRFSIAERVATSLNQPHTNQSYLAFAKDGTILLSAFRMAKSRPYLNIYQAADRANTFPKPIPLDALNTDDFNAHPTLSPSGKTVVFASTRQGGRGGIDIWTANRDESGAWQPPVNLGETLNSPSDEITPFLAADDSLYYASNGFGGKGGYEIYLSVRIDGRWQAPVPLTELNSEADDSDFTMLPGNIGVFASNRAGGRGGLDLYVSRFVPLSQIVSAVEYKIATQTNFFTLEEFSMTDVLPLPPCLFFEPNIATLPRTLKQLSSDETDQFSPQNLRPDPMMIYAEMLNIIGKRLQEIPSATLLLNVVESSNNALSRQRTESIRTYFQTTWNIDGKRILTATANAPAAKRRITGFAGEDAVRCVELSSSDARICAPVRIAGVNVLAKPRKLDVALDARPRVAMRSWTFSLIGDSRDTLYRTSGTTLPFSMTLPLEASSWANIPEQVTARFIGTDSLGRTGKRDLVMLAYLLPLIQKRTQKVQDKLIERYRFILPRETTDIALSTEQLDLIRDIASGLVGAASGITLTVTPFSFDERRSSPNEVTAIEKNAKQIADELRKQAPILLSQPPLIETLTDISSPETPEERIMSRTVIVTIERTVQSQQGQQQERRGR